eukprot:TRINITY_DN6897_c2_g1_i1.p1 TRINITY_DN6897_c2_g1~~TRINITY_DN6897_c2_g1_i1.p1  ORF type:complete len:163 (-),score=52.52 TRINITY_DN6897_c2_g1_i1:60-548(-)
MSEDKEGGEEGGKAGGEVPSFAPCDLPRDKHGASPLHWAAANAAQGAEALQLLFSAHGESGVQSLLEHTDAAGQNLLHVAVRQESNHVRALLDACRAMVAGRDEEGHTPLHVAAKFGFEHACAALMEAGDAQLLSATDRQGLTAFDLAVYVGRMDMAAVLRG